MSEDTSLAIVSVAALSILALVVIVFVLMGRMRPQGPQTQDGGIPDGYEIIERVGGRFGMPDFVPYRSRYRTAKPSAVSQYQGWNSFGGNISPAGAWTSGLGA